MCDTLLARHGMGARCLVGEVLSGLLGGDAVKRVG